MTPLANHLWQSTLFAALAWMLTLALRANSARIRHWVWMAASIKFLVPFSLLAGLGTRFAPLVPRPIVAPEMPVALESFTQPFAAPALSNLPAVSSIVPAIMFVLWIFGSAAVLIFWSVRWQRVRVAVRGARPLREGREWKAVLRLARRPVRLVASDASMEPGVFGIVGPVLMLPESIVNRLDDRQLDAILAHELCHVRRRDNLAAAAHMLVEAIFWFHPLVWWLGARLVAERERACDEEVLRLGSHPEVYAESILKICQWSLESPIACVAGVTGSDLNRRIKEIMTHRIGRRLSFARRLLLASTALAAVSVPVIMGLIHAQTTAELAFEVASVKPHPIGERGGFVGIAPSGQRFTASNIPARLLIMTAYGLTAPDQISGGPEWLITQTYDIDAKAERPASREQIYRMLQTLLTERFKLQIRRETKELPVYALVVDKGGPRLKVHTGPPETGTPIRPGDKGQVIFQDVPMERLAWFLSTRMGRSVLDQTGLKPHYDFELAWNGERPLRFGGSADERELTQPDPAGPSIFAALHEQLGLKLESRKGPVEFLTILHAEKPAGN